MTPRAFAKLPAKQKVAIRAAALRALELSALIGEDQVRRNLSGAVLNYRGPGGLRDSLRTVATSNGFKTTVGSERVVYARIHEFGGQIRPKRARYLRFKLPEGQWVSTKLVNMPARPYLRPAVAVAEKALQERLGPSIETALRGAA